MVMILTSVAFHPSATSRTNESQKNSRFTSCDAVLLASSIFTILRTASIPKKRGTPSVVNKGAGFPDLKDS